MTVATPVIEKNWTGHLDEQQQHQFGDVVAVVGAVVTEDVAKVPELLGDVAVGHGERSKKWAWG
ncbi:hypothetical protein D3C85_1673080 [compost metagenome]